MEQSAIMGVLQVNLSEIAIKGSTVVPLKIEKRDNLKIIHYVCVLTGMSSETRSNSTGRG